MSRKVNLKPLNEQAVVVFGAGSGIGRLTALQFAKKGAQVVVAARDEEALKSLVVEIEKSGGKAVYCVAEASHADHVENVARLCMETFGRLDSWVHVAGTGMYALLTDTTPDEFKTIFETNLLGTAHGILAAMPRLTLNGGAFIAISSVEAAVAIPYQGAYSASKFGVMGLLEALRREVILEGLPISVTNIMPMGINTPFFEDARTKLGVEGQPPPPSYQPEVVSALILHAAEHPTRDLVAGDFGYAFWWLQKLAPAIVDIYLARTAWQQRTKTRKSPNAPSNLQSPIGEERIKGNLNFSLGIGPLNWLDLNPETKRLVKIGALGALLLWIGRRKN